jgi:hypothetical protein
VGNFSGLLDTFNSAHDAYLAAYQDLTDLQTQRSDAEATAEGYDADQAALMEKAKDVSRSRLLNGNDISAESEAISAALANPNAPVQTENMFTRMASLDDVKAARTQMNNTTKDLQAKADRAAAEAEEARAQIADIDTQIEAQQQVVDDAIDAVNDAAYEIEKNCSAVRTGDRAAQDAVSGLDDALDGVTAAKSNVSSTVASHNASRTAAQDTVGAWYDELDQVGGVEGYLTFGTGADFAMSEEDFVAKWGPAIDRFYESYSGRAGSTVPLYGYGEAMARSAYRNHIDPRLCAAVSIAESSGGLYCIKSCNAWGWGAVDSDPYGGASAWDTWEGAIEAWTNGVATNSMGMATANSISALGDIYASSPAWPKNVATYIQEVSDCL